MDEIRKIVPNAGSYVAESNFFDEEWRKSFWGPNYERLLAVKEKYDSSGLFFVHHGIGSERWSADGFTRLDRIEDVSSERRTDHAGEENSGPRRPAPKRSA